MLMLDLCSGLRGASAAMKARGWQVITVDINPVFEPDVVADLRQWSYTGPRPDLVWCSPPCDEFSREFMPWSKTGSLPDMSIVLACKRIIDECQPRFWVIENVKGAIRWLEPVLGNYRVNYGPFYLWGYFPAPGDFRLIYRKKASRSSSAHAERAMIPAQLSNALALAIESQLTLTKLNPTPALPGPIQRSNTMSEKTEKQLKAYCGKVAAAPSTISAADLKSAAAGASGTSASQ